MVLPPVTSPLRHLCEKILFPISPRALQRVRPFWPLSVEERQCFMRRGMRLADCKVQSTVPNRRAKDSRGSNEECVCVTALRVAKTFTANAACRSSSAA